MRFATLLRFTKQGLEGVSQTAQRAQDFRKSVESDGVKIDELLWLSGQYDGLILFSAPDTESAAAAMLKLSQAGNVTTETLPAFDAEGMNRLLAKI